MGLPVVLLRPWWWVGLLATGLLVAGAVAGLTGAGPAVAGVAGIQAALAFLAVSGLHELGHVLAGRGLALWPARVELLWMGARTVYDRPAVTPRQKVVSAAAGPGANLIAALTAVAAGLTPYDFCGGLVAFGFGAINVAYAVLNLIPVYPQDGGQILFGMLWELLRSPQRALYTANLGGFGVSTALLGVGIGAGSLLLATLGAVLVVASVRLRR